MKMSDEISSVRIIDLLPESIARDEGVRKAAEAIQAEIDLVTAQIEVLKMVPDLDSVNAAVLDHLAWQWGVKFYSDTLPVEQRRTLVKQAFTQAKARGTKAAVQAVISAVFSQGVLEEWYQYGGDPYHFRYVSNEIITEPGVLETMIRAIETEKNARSLLERVLLRREFSDSIYAGLGIRKIVTTKLRRRVQPTIFPAVTMLLGETIKVFPPIQSTIFPAAVMLVGETVNIYPAT